MWGDKIYEYDLDVTSVTDFGVTMEAIANGEAPLPAQGLRLDVAFTGRATGRVAGQVTGIDHVWMRADGRVDLDVRAVLTTDDGARIALAATGVSVAREDEPIADLRENISLFTATEAYAWVTRHQIWGVGTMDFSTGRIHIDAYLQSGTAG